jgi:hypothetical protein
MQMISGPPNLRLAADIMLDLALRHVFHPKICQLTPRYIHPSLNARLPAFFAKLNSIVYCRDSHAATPGTKPPQQQLHLLLQHLHLAALPAAVAARVTPLLPAAAAVAGNQAGAAAAVLHLPPASAQQLQNPTTTAEHLSSIRII